MRIIYLHQYFLTPWSRVKDSAGTRSYEFARRLVKRGHQVEVLAMSLESSCQLCWKVEESEGIRIHWLPVGYSNSAGFLRRVWAFCYFAVYSSIRILGLQADLVFATSTPLTIGIPALIRKWLIGTPYVFEVRDLWPEAPIQLGVLRNKLLIHVVRRFEWLAYSLAEHVVVLSPGMREGVLAQGCLPHKVSMIPNACDLEFFAEEMDLERKRDEIRKQLGISTDSFVVLYAGAMGMANGLDEVLSHLLRLKEECRQKDVHFVFVGNGAIRPMLELIVEQNGLPNVHLLDPVPKAQIRDFYIAADACLVTFSPVPVLQTCSPNKFFDGLSAGRPILTNMSGWIAELVRNHECGCVWEAGLFSSFRDSLFYVADNKRRADSMGKHSRILGEKMFSRDKLCEQMLLILEKTVA